MEDLINKKVDYDSNIDYINLIQKKHNKENKLEKCINELEIYYIKCLTKKSGLKILNKFQAISKYPYIDSNCFCPTISEKIYNKDNNILLNKMLSKTPIDSRFVQKKCYWCNKDYGNLTPIISYQKKDEFFIVYGHNFNCER